MALLPRMEDPEHIRLSAEAIGRDGPIRCTRNGARYPMKHHRPGCGEYPNRQRDPYALGFPDVESAIAAGHPPCGLCKNKALSGKKPAGTHKPRKKGIHPKRVGQRMSPEARKQDIARKRKARRDMTPIEYERYLEKRRRERKQDSDGS